MVKKDMDHMDIDQVLDVPDTPDKVAAHNSNGNSTEREGNLFMNSHSISKDYLDESFRNRPREKNKSVTDNGGRRLFIRPQNFSNSTVSVLGNTSSCKNSLPTKRMMVDNTAKYENRYSSCSEASEKGKALSTSQSQRSACQEDSAFVDLTKKSGRAQVFEKVISTGASGNSRAHAFRKGSLSANHFLPLHGTADSSKTSGNLNKANEKVGEKYNIGSSFDRGKGVDLIVDARHKAGTTASAFLQPITSPRVTGQKRLVRNGCISPHNIAKVKQSSEKHDTGTVVKNGQNGIGTATSDGPPSVVDIKDLIAETKVSHGSKGKGLSNHPFSSKETVARSMHLSQRSSVTLKEDAEGSGDPGGDASRCFEGLDGWRTTRNRTKKVDPPLPDEDPHISRGMDDSCFGNQQHKNGVVRRDHRNGSSARNLNDYSEDLDYVSPQHVPAPSQTVSCSGHRLGLFNEHRQTVNALTKRQGQGSASSSLGECSTSAFDDSEIVFLSPSGESSNPRSTRNQDLHGVGILDPIIEVDEFSPEIRNNRSNTCGGGNEDSSARARQVEADEMLARELQEQLYTEVPGVGVGETDAHIALALQQETSQRTFPSGGHHVFHPSGSSALNFYQQSRQRRSQSPSIRRGIQAQAPTSARIAHLMGRFPGRSRTISSTPRNSLFPSNMDVDMRMHILEALEAISDMDVAIDFLQVDREFNENDYEMLLALDENNHQHGGSSFAQINGLPQSIVQTDNLEDCAICLETPTTGETIRHLPCLHRFHKDCIDPWLRRRTSCPVCKSSIT